MKYPIDLITTAPPASTERGTVDQGTGVIESTGGASLGATMNTRFSLNDQTLVINQVKVDLKKGSIVIIELATDGKVTVIAQCDATAPFNDDAAKYVRALESKCTEVAEFLKN